MSQGADPDTTPDWNELCRRYLDAVAAVSGVRTGSQDNPWLQTMRYWSQQPAAWSAPPSMPQGPLQQAEAFGPMAGLMGNFISQMAAAARSPDWEARLKSALDGIKSQAASPSNWRWPASAEAPGTDAVEMTAARDAAAAAWKPWLKTPEPGLKEQLEDGLQLWAEYQEKLQAYQADLARIMGRALDLLGERILDAANSERVFANVREIYDQWVECSEAAYAERVSTEEHAHCFADLVNALSAFRLNAQQVSPEAVGAEGPDLADDVRELRQQQAGMQQELVESRELRARDVEVIEALRLELEQLKQKLSK